VYVNSSEFAQKIYFLLEKSAVPRSCFIVRRISPVQGTDLSGVPGRVIPEETSGHALVKFAILRDDVSLRVDEYKNAAGARRFYMR